jgi:hypothetical protein
MADAHESLAAADLTLLQTVHLSARVGDDVFTLVASASAECCIGNPGFQEAIEMVLVSRGLVLRSMMKPLQYLTARALWSTKPEDAAAWSLARPPSPLRNALSLEVAGSGLFLAFDAGGRKFRMTKGLHPESVLSLTAVSNEQRDAWSMARVIHRDSISGPTAKEARNMLVEAFIHTELIYSDLLEELYSVCGTVAADGGVLRTQAQRSGCWLAGATKPARADCLLPLYSP